MSTPQNIDTFVSEAVVSMEIGTGFQVRIAKATEYLIIANCKKENGELDMDKIKAANTQIESGKITQEWVNHYETLAIFLKEFDMLAKAAGFLQ